MNTFGLIQQQSESSNVIGDECAGSLLGVTASVCNVHCLSAGLLPVFMYAQHIGIALRYAGRAV